MMSELSLLLKVQDLSPEAVSGESFGGGHRGDRPQVILVQRHGHGGVDGRVELLRRLAPVLWPTSI